MENKPKVEKDENDKDLERDLNANSAYSGSESMQPGGNDGIAGKLSEYPDGNLDDKSEIVNGIPGNQTDQQVDNNPEN